MRWRVKCRTRNEGPGGNSAPCGYEWETSGEEGANLAIADHVRGFPGHDVVKVQLATVVAEENG